MEMKVDGVYRGKEVNFGLGNAEGSWHVRLPVTVESLIIVEFT